MTQRKGLLMSDGGMNIVQVFTPSRVQAITVTTPWVPSAADIAFRNPVDVGYKIDGGTEVTLNAGSVTGIKELSTYTFNATIDIEVM